MSGLSDKKRSKSFINTVSITSSRKINYSPDKSEGKPQKDSRLHRTRFRPKDLNLFEPQYYVTAQLTIDDIIDLKQVFDTYDSTRMGVLLPSDLNLLLTQNDFKPNKNTLYEMIAEFDNEGCGGLSFSQFLRAMSYKPSKNQSKKEISSVFKKYDRTNKGYIDINDLLQINKLIKEGLDEASLKQMIKKIGSKQGRINFQQFYSVMVKNYNL